MPRSAAIPASPSLRLDAGTFAGLAAGAGAAEVLSAAAGCPLVVIDVPDAAAAARLDGLDTTALPVIVVLVVPEPGCLPPGAARAADIILTEDDRAPAPFIAPPAGLQPALGQLDAVVGQHPVAGTTLALLLRSSAAAGVPAALVAESAAYSALQAGAEFLTWRASRPRRPPPPGDDAERIRVTRTGTVRQVTLARAAKRNALDHRMRDALVAALIEVAADPSARLELRGTGPDFCAGGDLDEFGSRPDPAQAHLIRLTRSPARLMHQLARRTTVFLHGYCLGAGIELPAFAGHVVAAPDTRMGLPEIGLGLIPGAGGTASLPRRIGRHRTAFLALAGGTIGPDLALRWGLIDTVAEPDRAAVAARPPLAPDPEEGQPARPGGPPGERPGPS